MNYKALAVGALMGFLFALTPSCGNNKKCDVTNCAGCCDATGTCQVSGNATCGASGAACKACAATETCQAGVCTPATTGGGAGGGGGTDCASQGKCTKSGGGCGDSCSVGCCVPNDPLGRCITSPNPTLCGKAGATCTSCNSATETCVSTTGGSMCQSTATAADAGSVGKACANSGDCQALGGADYCKTTTNSDLDGGTTGATGFPYPGGYCTTGCQGTCPGTAICLNFGQIPGGLLGETSSMCVQRCDPTKTNSCRTGYDCFGVDPNDNTAGACLVDPPTPVGVTGLPCDGGVDDQCGPPPMHGSCWPEIYQGQPTGFVGGYCQASCVRANQPDYCGTDSACVAFSQTSAWCYVKCSNPDGGAMSVGGGGETPGQTTCRPGYVCTGGFNTATLGVCTGDCRNSPANCGTGDSCQNDGGPADGYCCPGLADGGTDYTGCYGFF